VSETRSFTVVCEKLEGLTKMDRLQARGTVRLALKEAGLDSASVTPREMSALVEKVLPAELKARGIAAPESICSELRVALSMLPQEELAETPDRVFARLGGGPGRT
jgi:hypothetical protein